MKLWMKALIWLGLGGGIGFFAGYRVGAHVKEEELESINERLDCAEKRNDMIEQNYAAQIEHDENSRESEIQRLEEKLRIANDAFEALQKYKGLDTEQLPFKEEEEDPEMPMEEPEMPEDPLEETEDEEEIQQPHPEDFRPYGITRSEYLMNEKGYDRIELDYYTEDAVIFDPKEEKKWVHPEQLLGIGWKARFIGSGDRPLTETYIQNDSMGEVYKITRIEGSFEELYEEE